jgi:NADP-dependent 3-hydroxy acid dehydrogenase YdfG
MVDRVPSACLIAAKMPRRVALRWPYVPELLVQPADVAEVLVAVVALPANAEVTEIRLRPAKKSC